MEDSDLQVLDNSAHYYMECSNKGKCDRTTGDCVCYDGYDGVACQRASCPGFPNSCSGHGVCKTKGQLATADYGNVYKLWDKDATMGCDCDPGYTGPDCSERTCKTGIDPLYLDDSATIKYSTYDFAILTTSTTADFDDGTALNGEGRFAIRFYDYDGEDWLTAPIVVPDAAGPTCADIVSALEALPGNVIPPGYTYCTKTYKTNARSHTWKTYDAQHPYGLPKPYLISYNLSIWEAITPSDEGELSISTPITQFDSSGAPIFANKDQTRFSGYIFRIKFYGNPGALKEPEIELYLDGKRPSLVSNGKKVVTKVWTDGQQGESKDYFADHCDKVTVTIGTASANSKYFLTGMTKAEKALLKACLGDSDFTDCNNQDTYNWDEGSADYPHLIKLVRTVTVYTDGGYYAAVWFDTSETLDTSGDSDGTFKLLNPFRPPDNFATDVYEVYTTKGTFALTSNLSEAVFSFATKNIFLTNTSYDQTAAQYDGDISCESSNDDSSLKFGKIAHCLNKTDLFTVLSWDMPLYNPPYINLYTATRIARRPFEYRTGDSFFSLDSTAFATRTTDELRYLTHVVNTDISTNWGQSITNTPTFRIYKFFPAVASTYEYVAECSNRGICARDTGICGCFAGYTNDDCSIQNSIAL
jgi:hypothetical protein